MGFRLRGRAFFLTYSQVSDDVSFSEIQSTICAYEPALYVRVAREAHTDGGTHYHAFVIFERVLDRIVSTQLDVLGHHPNIKPKGGRKASDNANKYCEKDGDFQDIGEYPDQEEEAKPSSVLRRAADYTSFTEFLCACADEGIQYGYCQAAWNALKTGGETIIDGTEDLVHVMDELLRGRVLHPDTDRVLVIVGGAGTGKTSWARAHSIKPALFVSAVDDLKSFVKGRHNSIIFDDVSFMGDGEGKGRWPITSQIHLCDWDHERSIHCRYLNVVIPKNIYKIFTCNDYPVDVHHPAIQRRITIVRV